MAIFTNDFIKRMNAKADKSLIGIGRAVAEIEKEVIQQDVYNYYDKIREGKVNVKYKRTYALLDGITVKYAGKGKVNIKNEGHPDEVIRAIIDGDVSWRNSILARLPEKDRKRDFIAGTYEALQSGEFDDIVKANLFKNGLRVER